MTRSLRTSLVLPLHVDTLHRRGMLPDDCLALCRGAVSEAVLTFDAAHCQPA